MPDFGDGSPREDYGAFDPNAQRLTPEQWAEYEAKRRKAALFGWLATLGGTTGLGFLGQALKGGGALGAVASGSDAAASVPPAAAGAADAATNAAGMIGGWGGTAGATGGGAGLGAAAAGAGGGAAAGAAKGILGGLSAKDLAAIGLGLGGTIGGALSDKPDMAPNTATNDPQLRALLDMMMQRMKKAEPLQDSVYSMANGLLPTQYQKGGGGMG